jgi:hypothetical protein
MREGRWHQATKDKTTYEIKRYLVEYFGDRALEEVTRAGLERRFGDSYRQYKLSVNRWLPTFRRWAPVSWLPAISCLAVPLLVVRAKPREAYH